MSWLTRIAERMIETARDAGDLQGIAGEGAPLSIENDGVDPVEAAGYKLMKSEGAVPPEVALRKRATQQQQALKTAVGEEDRRAAMAALAETQMRIAILSERRRGIRY